MDQFQRQLDVSNKEERKLRRRLKRARDELAATERSKRAIAAGLDEVKSAHEVHVMGFSSEKKRAAGRIAAMKREVSRAKDTQLEPGTAAHARRVAVIKARVTQDQERKMTGKPDSTSHSVSNFF